MYKNVVNTDICKDKCISENGWAKEARDKSMLHVVLVIESSKISKISLKIKSICLGVYLGKGHVRHSGHVEARGHLWSPFSPPFTWVLWVELRHHACVASASIH